MLPQASDLELNRHRHLVLIGRLGKVLGPAGFVWSVASGSQPNAFGLTILFNDVIGWPAFFGFVRAAAHGSGGLVPFLKGG